MKAYILAATMILKNGDLDYLTNGIPALFN